MNFPWEKAIMNVVSEYKTPCYISAWQPVIEALNELRNLETKIPIKHWLSFKTHPVRPLITKWRDMGLGIEVVSEYEFLAAIKEGYQNDKILINGVAKHHWLNKYNEKNIKVHFDSIQEIDALMNQASNLGWMIGLRCHVTDEFDPDEPSFGGQFGLSPNEIEIAVEKLSQKGLNIKSVHFHLRTNVSSADSYINALNEISAICLKYSIYPLYIDCGGGLPAPNRYGVSSSPFDFELLKKAFSEASQKIPSATEIWLENGRFISERSAVLVVRVLDIKERGECRYLICDGGRTNHALVSDWETHEIFCLPHRHGIKCLTTVCGPTCMAYDRLSRTYLPNDIRIGDYIVWMDAGAYHLPWETRFSHGLANVVWYEESGDFFIARQNESFEEWWGKWLLT